MPPRLLRLGTAFLALFPQILLAQATFRTDVNLVTLAVRVTDAKGRDIRDLSREDFTVLEDGRPQELAVFSTTEQPVSLAILVDNSSSMRVSGRRDVVRSAVERMIKASPADTELMVAEFGDRCGHLQDVSRLRAPAWVRDTGADADAAGTALYDSVVTALCELRTSRYPRQALIVVTDGADQASRLRLEQLVEAVRGSLAQLFFVGCFGREEYNLYKESGKTITLVTGREVDNPLFAFRQLSRESGAEALFATTDEEIRDSVERIRENLEAQYAVGYYLKTAGEQYHRIQVRVRRHGAKVRARRGVSSLGESLARYAGTDGGCQVSPGAHPFPYESKLHVEGGRRVYEENFSDRASGWPDRKGASYKEQSYRLVRPVGPEDKGEAAGVTRDLYHHRAGGARAREDSGVWADPGGTLVGYGPWWGDFRASVTVDLPLKSDGRAGPAPMAGLAFRINDTGYYALLVSEDGRMYKLAKQVFSGESSDLIPWTPVQPQGAKGSAMRLSIESAGTKLTVLLGARQVASYTDRKADTGMVGMVLFGDGHAVFRELRAEDLQTAP